MLKGYKTYIIAALLLVVEGLHASGYITTEMRDTLRNLLGAGAVATVAAKINRVNAKIAILVPYFLLLANAVSAQTPTAVWEYDALPTEVATYTQVIRVDTTTISGTPVCVAAPSNRTACSLPIGTLSPGSHVISITATKGGMSSELRVTGINPNNAPKSPSNFKITIVVTVEIPNP